MNDSCSIFRSAWLFGEASAGHDQVCPACIAWRRNAEQQVEVLRGLPRLAVPAELAFGVEDELAGRRERRMERILSSLVQHGAPAALDEHVRVLLGIADAPAGDEARGEQRAGLLGALDVQPAPPVLERLVDEELAAPEAHRAARFSGDLPRLDAPAMLEERVDRSFRRRAWRRLVIAPIASLAAAGAVVWFVVRRTEEPARAYSFGVVHASSLDGIDPLARQLAVVLGGAPPVAPGSIGEAR